MRLRGYKMKAQSIDTKKVDKRVQGVIENWVVARVLWMRAKGQYSLGQGLEIKRAKVQKAAVASEKLLRRGSQFFSNKLAKNLIFISLYS